MEKNAFDLTVEALRARGLDPGEILRELSRLFRKLSESECEEPKRPLTMKEKERKIKNILIGLGISEKNKGFQYIVKGVFLYQDNRDMMHKGFYPAVANEFATKPKPKAVESAMRYEINMAWNKGNRERFKEIFGESDRLKKGLYPTTSEFFARLSEMIQN